CPSVSNRPNSCLQTCSLGERTVSMNLQASARARLPGHPWMFLLSLAVLYTLLNAPKPLHIDDAAYYAYAAHIADHPLDPYGFTLIWYDRPQPANAILAPPVLPYWWGLAIRLFGEQVVLWKLWLWPFSFLLVVGLYALARRFSQSMEQSL